jgi:RNA polymerase sigma-70 factor (ECF subfamily)
MTADPNIDARKDWGGSTSRSLLAEARHEDRAAWARLVTLYAPLVATWCRRLGVVEQDVVDVLQDVFVAVSSNLSGFRKEQPQDTFRGWLSTITRNKVRDYYRRRADQPDAAGGTDASRRLSQLPDVATAVQDGDVVADDGDCRLAFSGVLSRALESIREEFHEPTWQAFWSVAVEGRAAADVASELGMQPGAVRVAKSRILARLRRELGDIER